MSNVLIGERFDYALKKLKITNKEIVEKFNISSQNVSNLKKNDRLNDLISKIASEYNININWLITGNGNYKIENHQTKEDENKLLEYFTVLQSVAIATNKEDELIVDIRELIKKYME